MKEKIILKPGPITVLKRILLVEVLSSVAIALFSLIKIDYQSIYDKFFFSEAIPLSVFLMIIFTLLQIVILVSLFLQWTFDLYEVYKDKVIRKYGIFRKSSEIRPFNSLTSIRLNQGAIGKWLNFASIELEDQNSGQIIIIPEVARADDEVEKIEEIIKLVEVKTDSKKSNELSKLLKAGESKNAEFKESFRWDKKKGSVNKDLENNIMRSVSAFMNTEGGKLLIGVSDSGEVVGLDDDYKSVKRKNSDSFENHFMTIFTDILGSEFAHYLELKFEDINEKTICVVNIDKSNEPVFYKVNNEEKLFVRAGNTTRELNVREAFKYIKTNFSNYSG